MPWSAADTDQLDPSTGEPQNETGVRIRRARLSGEHTWGAMHGRVEFDGDTTSGPRLRLLAAEVGWRLPGADPGLEVVAGLFKVPFGGEVPTPERERAFLETPTWARALFPGNFDAGVRAHGQWRYLRVDVAAMNGAPVGDAQWRGADPSASLDLLGRVGVVAAGCGWRVDAGASALVGDGLHPGAPPTKDELVWVDANEDGLVQTTELQVIDGDPGTPAESFDRHALGADVRVRWWARGLGWGHADLEGVIAGDLDRGVVPSDPIALGRTTRQLGWHVGATQSLGARVVVGARYDRYRADRDAQVALGADLVRSGPTWSTWALLASVHHGPWRVSAEYDRERNPLGLDDAGRPTTRADDRVVVRAQWGR